MIIFAAIQAAVLLSLTLCGWVLPALADPARPFGVPVPEAPAQVDAVRRRYRLTVLAAGAAVTTVTLAATWHGTVTAIGKATTAAIAVLFLFGWSACCHARATLRRVTAEPLVPPPDTATRPPAAAGAFPGRWVLPVVGALALTVAIGATRYHSLPPALPTRWTAGLADRFATTSAETVFSLVPPQLLLTLIVLAVIGSAWPGGTGRARAAARRTTRALLALCGLVQVCLLGGSLVLWGVLPVPPA